MDLLLYYPISSLRLAIKLSVFLVFANPFFMQRVRIKSLRERENLHLVLQIKLLCLPTSVKKKQTWNLHIGCSLSNGVVFDKPVLRTVPKLFWPSLAFIINVGGDQEGPQTDRKRIVQHSEHGWGGGCDFQQRSPGAVGGGCKFRASSTPVTEQLSRESGPERTKAGWNP